MRCFIALPLPNGPARALERAAVRLAGDLGGRAIPAANMHVTLFFAGEVDTDRVRGLSTALRRAWTQYGPNPFLCTLAAPGVFGSAQRSRTVWAGLDHVEGVRRFHGLLMRALCEEGLAHGLPVRPLVPHVTVVRGIRSRRAVPKEVLSTWWYGTGLDGQMIRIAAPLLMESRLRPEGAEYRIIGRT